MNWFESWFNSPYYHILYQHRSDKEALDFIDVLYQNLNIQTSDTILDLACGAGRHAIALALRGNSTVGIDLASHSINEARKKAAEAHLDKLDFQVADMRDFSLQHKFDYIFNLFTSFGYFDDKSDNRRVAECIARHQKQNGIVVIDYLNSQLICNKGNHELQTTLNGIDFFIEKYIENDIVYKSIRFEDKGKSYHFREQVQLFQAGEIFSYFEPYGYQVISTFGDYFLNPYIENSSPRFILLMKKMDNNK